MYLSYVECDELPAEEKYVLATDIALAALTGEEVNNVLIIYENLIFFL